MKETKLWYADEQGFEYRHRANCRRLRKTELAADCFLVTFVYSYFLS